MLLEHYFLFEEGLDPIEREEEEELRRNAWFDYRIMTAAECTFLFAKTYQRTFARYHGKLFDIREELRTCPQINNIAPIWEARQAADRIGCKYDFYLNVVFSIFDARGWQKLPTAKQLQSEELSIDISRMWQERCDEVLQLAESEHFTGSRYKAHPSAYPEQIDYYRWLIAQLRKRPHGGMVAKDLIKRGIFPVYFSDIRF